MKWGISPNREMPHFSCIFQPVPLWCAYNKTTVVRRSFFSTLGHLCNQECLYISVFDAFYMGQVGKAWIAPKNRLIH